MIPQPGDLLHISYFVNRKTDMIVWLTQPILDPAPGCERGPGARGRLVWCADYGPTYQRRQVPLWTDLRLSWHADTWRKLKDHEVPTEVWALLARYKMTGVL